jgi:hypothetical protein
MALFILLFLLFFLKEVSLADVRKEISFCNKTGTKIIGVVENMSGFVCPNCSHESHIFAPVTGGAEKMCNDMGIPLLAKVPLDPNILMSCEKGKFLGEGNENSKAAREYEKIGQGNFLQPSKKKYFTYIHS